MPSFSSLRPRLLPLLMRALVTTLAFALIAAGLVTPDRGRAQDGAPLAPAFGPILFGVSGGTLPDLPIHARIMTANGELLIASGEAADIEALRAQGAVVTILDGATTGRIYYLADATTEDAAGQAQAVADVLLAGTDVLLLATTPEREATLLATLPANGIAVALLDAAIAGEA